MATQLNGIHTLTKHLVVPSPSINTTVIANPTKVPITCPAIVAAVKANTPSTFLQLYAIPTIITNLQSLHKALTTGVDENQTITDGNNLASIQSYLTKIDTIQVPILKLVKACTGETSQPVSNDAYAAAKERLSTSMERLEFIQNPEQYVSYYEGWFPIFRPMVRTALFGLFGVSLFLLLLSIILFLRMNGIELKLVFPESADVTQASIPSTYTYAAGAAIAIGLLVGYYGNKNGWFGS